MNQDVKFGLIFIATMSLLAFVLAIIIIGGTHYLDKLKLDVYTECRVNYSHEECRSL